MADDDEEETEIYYVPKIPKIVIVPISFHTPTVPPKPVSPGTTTPPEAPIYTPEWVKRLNLMTSYDVSVYVSPASAKDLLLATEYRVSLPELLEAAKDLSLKTEVLLQMMNWFVESNLLLKTEPTIVAHYGLLFDTFLKLKTDYTATLPEFKTYEADLSLKTENIVELMAIIERAKNLGLSVEVGVIPTIGVTMDIYAGTRVEVELTSITEILMTVESLLKTSHVAELTIIPVTAAVESLLKTSHVAELTIIPVTVNNRLKIAYGLYAAKFTDEMYPGYTTSDFIDRSAIKDLRVKVTCRTEHLTEMYQGYSISDFWDAEAYPEAKLKTEYSLSLAS